MNPSHPESEHTEGLTKRQWETLAEIETRRITTVQYASGPSYWGPLLVFSNEDLQALAAARLICSEGTPKLTDLGLVALHEHGRLNA
jgi:hypothetical protein